MSWSRRLEPHHSYRFDSGLRLLVQHRQGLRSAVCLSLVRGGARSDPPGAAGTAHLSEHLLTQGLAPDGERWVTPIVAAGGDVAATTHPDYLEYCFEGPHAALPHALRLEQERLTGWPTLRRTEFVQQRDAVCQEIARHVQRASGPLPWPLLGDRVFDSWQDAHDPFGDIDQVADLTEADCRSFSERLHGPGGTVVVVVADLARVPGGSDSIAEFLAVVPPRVVEDVSATAPGPLRGTGLAMAPTWSASSSAAAIAWPTPSVSQDPGRYAGLLAVAECLTLDQGRARLGQMEPLDRVDADVLTLTVTDQRDARPQIEEALDQLRDVAWRPRASTEVWQAAVERTRADAAVRLDHPAATARLLARAALLDGDPADATRWIAPIQALEVDQAVEAGRWLAEQPWTGLVGLPQIEATKISGPSARTASRTPRPDFAAPATTPAASATTPMVTLPTEGLTTAITVRLGQDVDPGLIRAIRSFGHRVGRDPAGWLVSALRCGPAPDVAEVLRHQIFGSDRSTPVRHWVVVGPDADDCRPWPHSAGATRTTQPFRPGIRPRHGAGLPAKTAVAQLAWRTECAGFWARWLGVALLADLPARSRGGDPRPLAAPDGLVLGLRQDSTPGGRSLVFDVVSTPDRAVEALTHLNTELGPDRLAARSSGLAPTVISLIGQWRRDESHPAVAARRSMSLLDLGAPVPEIPRFAEQLAAVTAEEVVDRLLRDTAGAPDGWLQAPDAEHLVAAVDRALPGWTTSHDSTDDTGHPRSMAAPPTAAPSHG